MARPTKARQQAATAQLLEMLAKHSGEDVDELKKTVAPIVEENPFSTDTMQKELCLEFINHPGRYTTKKCKRCGEFFGSSYMSVAYCSDLCRSREFKETTGVDFNTSGKSQVELWGGEPPRIIKPTLWKTLAGLLQTLAPMIESSEPPRVVSDEASEASEEVSEVPHPQVQSPVPANPPEQPVPSGTIQFDAGSFLSEFA